MENNELRILNEFGIEPVTNYTAAGLDFFVPNILVSKGYDTKYIIECLAKSYKTTPEALYKVGNFLQVYVLSSYSESKVMEMTPWVEDNYVNLIHLYCALKSMTFEDMVTDNVVKFENDNIDGCVNDFCATYLIIPKNVGEPFGINVDDTDHLLFNSGIHVALPQSTAGVFMNKSGKGSAGFDVRAQVVDEDYTGFVHLNLAYTRYTNKESKVFIGDKITQMLVLPIVRMTGVKCLNKEDYDTLMAHSHRGADGFGSSDVKH